MSNPTTTPTTPTLQGLVYHPIIGIIGNLRTKLWDPNGVTKGEMLTLLTQLFPTRDPYGMSVTVQIQLGRLQRKWGKIVSVVVPNRGRVYGFQTHLQVTGEVVGEDTPTVTPYTPTPYTQDELDYIEMAKVA